MAQTSHLSTIAVCAVTLAAATSSSAQTPYASEAPWSGWAQCVTVARGGNYFDEQSHTWRLTGEPPRGFGSGSTRHWPGVWSATGRGSRGTDTWTIVAPDMPGEIGIVEVPASNNIRIFSVHSPIVSPAGVRAVGVPGWNGNFSLQEHAFPAVEGPKTGPTISGTRTREIPGGPGFRKPFDVLTVETCTWHYSRGDVASAAPPPPPMAAGAPAPSPVTPSAAAPPPTAAPAATPPVATAAPPGGVPSAAAPSAGVPRIIRPDGTIITGTPPPAAPAAAAPPATTAVTPPATHAPSSGAVATANPRGVLTPMPSSAGAAAPTPEAARDPADFTVRQSGEGTVTFTWSAVPGAGSYLLGGPGTDVGIMVNGTSHTLTGIPQGTHTWTVATNYNSSGVVTTADRWPRATATVTNTTGRYRVLMTGFRVNRATYDDQFNGNGDEVFAAAGVVTIDRRDGSLLQPWAAVKSDSYGDVGRNPQFVRAGSFGATGGLWAGDVVPPGSDPRTTAAPSSATRFPLALWEGTLRDGIDAVVVTPTIWEIDGNPEYYSLWVQRDTRGLSSVQVHGGGSAHFAAIKGKADGADATPFLSDYVFRCGSDPEWAAMCGGGSDRPIGIAARPCFTWGGSTPAWCDVVTVFTREAIERLLSGPQVAGTPAGFVTIPFVEPTSSPEGRLEGSYELFLRVERVP